MPEQTFTGTTDQNGQAAFDTPAGSGEVAVSHSSYRAAPPQPITVVDEQTTEAFFRLDARAGRLVVSVVAGPGGAPVAGAAVTVTLRS